MTPSKPQKQNLEVLAALDQFISTTPATPQTQENPFVLKPRSTQPLPKGTDMIEFGEALKALVKCPLFEGVSENSLRIIACYCTKREVQAGTQLINPEPEKTENPLVSGEGMIIGISGEYTNDFQLKTDFAGDITLAPNMHLGERGFLVDLRSGTVTSKQRGEVFVISKNLSDLGLPEADERIILLNAIKNTHLSAVNQRLEESGQTRPVFPTIATAQEALVKAIGANIPRDKVYAQNEFKKGEGIPAIEGYIFIIDSGNVRIQTMPEEDGTRPTVLSTIETGPSERNLMHEAVGAGREQATAQSIAATNVKGRYVKLEDQPTTTLKTVMASMFLKTLLADEALCRRMEHERNEETTALNLPPLIKKILEIGGGAIEFVGAQTMAAIKKVRKS